MVCEEIVLVVVQVRDVAPIMIEEIQDIKNIDPDFEFVSRQCRDFLSQAEVEVVAPRHSGSIPFSYLTAVGA